MTEALPPQQTQQVPATAVPDGVDPVEYAKQMAARAEGTPAAPPAEKLLAGKYRTVDDLEKGYNELLRLHGSKPPAQTQTPPAQQQTQQTPNQQNATQQQAEQVAQSAGLDLNKLSAEYAETGELAEASYEALAKVGITKDIVNQFINGQIAAQTIARNEVHSIVGGAENYGQLVNWAKDNLDQGEISAFNKVANSGDITAIKLAVGGLKAKFDAAFGSEPNLVADNLGSGGSAVGYRSKAEMTKDMGDPRYATDPAFRQDVMNKLRVTTAF